ncbi:hypothetical protein [Methylobacter sp. BlB1]|uniref:hypothetical protein n=1 Tax=Methylobacter sp. BlB1 TaxID=2785914 RepID=UPI001895DE00|nr:hypothetical protein [Methylobacter sp. BlB1]MBF6647933.1 hypothetical protein [Methylobacter sp. BlB1]
MALLNSPMAMAHGENSTVYRLEVSDALTAIAGPFYAEDATSFEIDFDIANQSQTVWKQLKLTMERWDVATEKYLPAVHGDLLDQTKAALVNKIAINGQTKNAWREVRADSLDQVTVIFDNFTVEPGDEFSVETLHIHNLEASNWRLKIEAVGDSSPSSSDKLTFIFSVGAAALLLLSGGFWLRRQKWRTWTRRA